MPGESGRKSDNRLVVDCPHCGCPNRPFDNRCAYCREDISSISAAKPGFWESVANRFRKRGAKDTFHADNLKPAGRSAARSVIKGIVSALLVSAGLYAVYVAISGAGALFFCVGLLLLLYGLAGFGALNKVEEPKGDDAYLQ